MAALKTTALTVILTATIAHVGLSKAVPASNTSECVVHFLPSQVVDLLMDIVNNTVNGIGILDNLSDEEEPVSSKLFLHLLQKMEIEQTQLRQEQTQLRQEQTQFRQEQTQLRQELSRISQGMQDTRGNVMGDPAQEGEESLLGVLLRMQEDFMEQLKAQLTLFFSPRDCYDLLQEGKNISGVYTIYPQKCGRVGEGVRVWCDMEGSDGGWTVFLNRMPLDEQVDFNRGWREYRLGFGDPETEYWLGNDVLHAMTSSTIMILRVDMMDWDGETRYAEYNNFQVEDADSEYRLHLGSYSGTAGDALRRHNDMLFSTPDRENDTDDKRNCAVVYHAGFWFCNCYQTGPTNRLLPKTKDYQGITWLDWHSDKTTLQKMSFKIKPASCRN